MLSWTRRRQIQFPLTSRHSVVDFPQLNFLLTNILNCFTMNLTSLSSARLSLNAIWTLVILLHLTTSSAQSGEVPVRSATYTCCYRVLLNQMTNLTCPYDPSDFYKWSSPQLPPSMLSIDIRKKVLRFKADSTDMSGEYTCSAIGGHGSSKTTLYLQVIDPNAPSLSEKCAHMSNPLLYNKKGMCFTRNYSPAQLNMKADLENTVTMDCQVMFDDPNLELSYSWTLPPNAPALSNLDLLPPPWESRPGDRSSLTFRVGRGMSGEYQCMVIGPSGRRLIRTFNLAVAEPLIIGPRVTNMTVEGGSRTLLTCETLSTIKMSWVKIISANAKNVPTDESLVWEKGTRIIVKTSEVRAGPGGKTTIHELVLDPVTSSDAGQYVCKAIGGTNEDEKFVHLSVIENSPRNGGVGVPMTILLFILAVVVTVSLITVSCYFVSRHHRRRQGLRSDSGLTCPTNGSGSHLQPMLSGPPYQTNGNHYPHNLISTPSGYTMGTKIGGGSSGGEGGMHGSYNSKGGSGGPQLAYQVDPYPQVSMPSGLPMHHAYPTPNQSPAQSGLYSPPPSDSTNPASYKYPSSLPPSSHPHYPQHNGYTGYYPT